LTGAPQNSHGISKKYFVLGLAITASVASIR
jgi:hypothetical protein